MSAMKKWKNRQTNKDLDMAKDPIEQTKATARGLDIAGTIVESQQDDGTNSSQGTKRDWRFWAVFISLAMVAFLSALEGSIVSTALPAISRAINAGENYVWIVNMYLLTSAVVQPLYGQLADLWGRRWLMISTVGVFTVGSGICGAANNVGVLIAGRAIQGLGAAGINTVVEIIICDLLPLRERGQFIGMMFGVVILGAVLGPFLGGLLVEKDWRWTFYLNLPLGVTAMVVLFFLLNAPQTAGGGGGDGGAGDDSGRETLASKIKRIDFLGLLVLCGSITSILYAITYGGTSFVWSDGRIIASMTVGAFGIVLFILFEASRFCKEPMLPAALFSNRTSAAAFMGTFIQTIVSFWILYFIPLFFQSTLLVSPSKSGLYILPFSFLYGFSAVIGGGITTKLGKFKMVQVFGFALMVISLGTFSTWNRNTPTGVWVVTQLLSALSVGIVSPSLLTAVQADLPASLNAPSTAAFAFVRSIGTIFGVGIPAAIFNNRFDELLAVLDNDAVTERLARGKGFEQASKALVESFADPAVRDAVVRLYELSLQRIWQVGIAVAGIGFLAVLCEKDLRTSPEQQEDNKDDVTQTNDEEMELDDVVTNRASSRFSTARSTSRMTWYSVRSTTTVQRRWTNWDQELTGWRSSSRLSWGQLSPYSVTGPMTLPPRQYPNIDDESQPHAGGSGGQQDWTAVVEDPQISVLTPTYHRHSR